MRRYLLIFSAILIISGLISAEKAFSWGDKGHLAIAKAAGYNRWYNAAGADIAKIKAGNTEAFNHFSNNPQGTVITKKTVYKQIKYYNSKKHSDGHLYGAILAAVREYLQKRRSGKHAEPHLDYAVHYIGDLSQPLHNTVYNSFNRKNHMDIDMMANRYFKTFKNRIKIYPVTIKDEDDLAKKIADLANISTELGYLIEKENRTLTEQETEIQISHSASLIRGLLDYLNPEDSNRTKENDVPYY